MQGFLSEGRRADVLQVLRTDSGTLSRDYLKAARAVLEEIVANPEAILRLPLERKPGSYARNLLVGDDGVSVWAMVWSPGAATSIHDHHCSCCFGVVSGTVTETWYRAVDESRAVPTQEHAHAGLRGLHAALRSQYPPHAEPRQHGRDLDPYLRLRSSTPRLVDRD